MPRIKPPSYEKGALNSYVARSQNSEKKGSSSEEKESNDRIDTYRTGITAENLKFGKDLSPEELNYIRKELDDHNVQRSDIGFNFDISQARAFNALQILLDKFDHEGNVDPEIYYGENNPIYSNDYKAEYNMPVLLIDWTDYFKAFGLEKNRHNVYSGGQKEKARKALKDLTKPRIIFYKVNRSNPVSENKEKIVVRKSLIDYSENISAINSEWSKKGELLISFTPLFVENIETFFIRKPVDLYKEIQEACDSNRVSKYHFRLIEHLLITSHKKYKIGRKKLARKLRMHNYVNKSRWSVIREKIWRGLEIANDINVIDRFQYDEDNDNYIIELTDRCNISKKKSCSRVPA